MSQRKSKKQRWYIKRQKRLIKLMYRKGLLNDCPLNTLQWVNDHSHPFIGRVDTDQYGNSYIPIITQIIWDLDYCYQLEHIRGRLNRNWEWKYDGIRALPPYSCELNSIIIKALKEFPTLRHDSRIKKILIFRI